MTMIRTSGRVRCSRLSNASARSLSRPFMDSSSTTAATPLSIGSEQPPGQHSFRDKTHSGTCADRLFKPHLVTNRLANLFAHLPSHPPRRESAGNPPRFQDNDLTVDDIQQGRRTRVVLPAPGGASITTLGERSKTRLSPAESSPPEVQVCLSPIFIETPPPQVSTPSLLNQTLRRAYCAAQTTNPCSLHASMTKLLPMKFVMSKTLKLTVAVLLFSANHCNPAANTGQKHASMHPPPSRVRGPQARRSHRPGLRRLPRSQNQSADRHSHSRNFRPSDWAKEMADELAAQGFIVIAPDLLWFRTQRRRLQRIPQSGPTIKAVSGLNPDVVNADLDAAADYGKHLRQPTAKSP